MKLCTSRGLDGRGAILMDASAGNEASHTESGTSAVDTVSWRAVSLAALPALLVLLIHGAHYYPFIADDALISLRYADRLAAGQGLTWTDGERVEGYSNLTWVLANALLHRLGLDLILASRLLGALGLLGGLWCVVAWQRRAGRQGLLAGGVAAVAAALTGPLAVWLVGGLEQPFVVLFLSAALVGCRELLEHTDTRAAWCTSLSFALLCLTRPDGPLLALVTLVGLFAARGCSWANLSLVVKLGVPSLLAIVGQLLFRLSYYGDWVPNTARAKVAFSIWRLLEGGDYVRNGAAYLWPMLAAALAAVLLGRAFQRRVLLLWAPFVTWTAYVVFVGGDIFPGQRHLVVLVVLAAFLIGDGLSGVLARWRAPRATALSCVPLLACQLLLSFRDPQSIKAAKERWEWDGQAVGIMLKRAFTKQRPLLAVDTAGSLPFFSELASLDMLGLNDRYLARHPPKDFGKGYIGHELGDGSYVYRRKPDLVLFCFPDGNARGCNRADLELTSLPGFQRDYLLVNFRAREPYVFDSKIYVRRQGAVGVQEQGQQVRIPGFLLAAHAGVAVLDERDRMVAQLPANAELHFELSSACVDCELSIDATAGVTGALRDGRTIHVHTAQTARVRELVLIRKN